MRLPGYKSSVRLGRWIRSRLSPGAVILGYHRIDRAVPDPYDLCVSPDHFAQQLEVLRKWARPKRLSELVQDVRTGRSTAQTVVLTFDDGYVDILDTIYPLLERYEIPATVFITTGNLGRAFWWDELYRLIYTPDPLPERLSLQLNGGRYDWPSDGITIQETREADRGLLVHSLHDRFHDLSPEERGHAFEQLKVWSGKTVADKLPAVRAMTEDEIRKVDSGGLIEIGAHTVNHPVLYSLPPAEQTREILKSKQHLESILDKPVHVFSYPHGSWSETTEEIVREAGYSCACASASDVVRRHDNRYRLPRFWVRNEGGELFDRWLKRWLAV